MTTAIVRRFLEEGHSRGLSPNTITNLRNTLRRLSEWAQTNDRPPVLYLTQADILDWTVEQSRSVQPATLHGYLVQIRIFFDWATTRRLLDVDPTTGIDLPKLPARLPDPMPEDTYQLVMGQADTQMRATLGLAGFAGLRACEIADLPWPAVRWGDGLIRVQGKGRKERIAFLGRELAEILTALPSRRGPVVPRRDGRPGFNRPHTISHQANRFLHAHGCEDWTLHSLRHRFATCALDATGDIAAVSQLLGHASTSTTQIYAKISTAHLRAAAAGADGYQNGHPDVA